MGIFSFICCLRNKPRIYDDPSKGALPDPKPVVTKNAGKPEPYSEGRARQLFKTYEDPDTPGEIGPEGFEKLCTDLDISLEGALPLVLAWQMHATEMAKFKETEWLNSTGELRVSNLQVLSLVLRNIEDILLLDKPPIVPSGTGSIRKRGAAVSTSDTSEPYNRHKYLQYAADTKKAYAELYAFCFALAKPSTARNIDMDTASAFWSVLVAPKYPIMKDILEFINEKGTYKGVNKDLWNMVLEFCRSMQADLSSYEADGAWPTMLDDFVTWKKAKLHGEGVNVEGDD
ncbi:Cullin binding-domain-containing protein [Ganoderma leucocontextum]|nr:Cullin binding-domain-containing protein [Ganoderma leucocontextum]